MKLNAKKRELKGKKVKNLRAEGQIPASIYGPKMEPINLVIEQKELTRVYKEAGSNTIIDLEVEGEKESFPVLIKEEQQDPLKGNFIHVSFYAIDATKKIGTEIPVEVTGVSPAVKNNIGFLVTEIDEIEVISLPRDIPSEIVIDISNLQEIGDSIKLSDIKLPANVELPNTVDLNTYIVQIVPPQKEIVEEEPVVEEELAEGEEGVEGAEGVEGEEGAEGAEGGKLQGEKAKDEGSTEEKK